MRSYIITLLLVIAAFLPVPAHADDREAYNKSVDSVVWLRAIDQNWDCSYGSGVVISTSGYILTAYHVVGDDRLITASFPARNPAGAIIGEADHYVNSPTNLALCVVVARDPKRDLALLRLKSPPQGLKAMPVASHSPSPGNALFTIGNTAPPGPLWRYANGTVRQVYQDSYRFKSGQTIHARVVATSVSANGGDSGSALIDETGSLVGINSALDREANPVHKAIDVTEIRAFIEAYNKGLKK